MKPTKQDDELWYVQLASKEVEIHTIPISQKDNYKQGYIFDTYEDAEFRALELDNLYNGIFKYRPYLSEAKLVTNLYELIEIEKKINEGLSDYPQFNGIDFCDVNTSGIQIRGFHKQVKGYCFGSQITIKYDFSNYKECITEFIEMWKARDTVENLKQYQSFLADGERWGWD